MSNNTYQEDEIHIDFRKIFNIICYRKDLILKVFVSIVLFFIFLTFILPKKYETDASLYISKSNDTNLYEINPYIISSISSMQGGLSGMLSGSMMNSLQNEIEIMKSPLVMDKVIKENNLRYKKGPKKGELLTTGSFVNKNLSIDIEKGTNIVIIKYKSQNPELNYKIVNSIINNYEKVNEEININKTLKDKKLLEEAYKDTTSSLNKKFSEMQKTSAVPEMSLNSLGMLSVLKGHNKSIRGAMNNLQSNVLEGKKSEIKLQEDISKLSLVKSKLDWTKLVEQMSKDRTNFIVLKQPEIKRSFEQKSPKLKLNIIFGIILGLSGSLIALILAETIDKKLTYSSLGDNVIYNIEKNPDNLNWFILANSKTNLAVLKFEGFDFEILKQINGNIKIINADMSQETVDKINASDKLIFAAKIGQTPKRIYQNLKNICEELNKKIYIEIV